MLGAIAGDIIGSVYDTSPIKTKAFDVNRDQTFQHRCRARTLDNHLTHMGDVEQPRRLARLQVLLDNARWILNRHVVPGEGHHFGTQFSMQGIQWRGQKAHMRFRLGQKTATLRTPGERRKGSAGADHEARG